MAKAVKKIETEQTTNFSIGDKKYQFTMPTFEYKRKVYQAEILAFEIKQSEEEAINVANELIEMEFGGIIEL